MPLEMETKKQWFLRNSRIAFTCVLRCVNSEASSEISFFFSFLRAVGKNRIRFRKMDLIKKKTI